MATAKTIITEEALEDYVRCPMRYAFIWHYGIDPDETFCKFRSLLRSALTCLYKCRYETSFTQADITAYTKDVASIAGPVWPHIWGILLKHAVHIKDWLVVAYSVPTIIRAGNFKFTGIVDLVASEEHTLRIVHLHSYTSSTTDASASLLTDSVRSGFSNSVLTKAYKTFALVQWQSMSVVRSTMYFRNLPDVQDVRPFISSVGRGIGSTSFYPRGNTHTCYGCYFGSICNTKWCTTERLRKPNETKDEILSELKRCP